MGADDDSDGPGSQGAPGRHLADDQRPLRRIIDTRGDGFLAECASVVNAVECAVAVQKTIAVRNADVSVRCMQFPIGVNLGDVIHDNAREYGDGVNRSSLGEHCRAR